MEAAIAYLKKFPIELKQLTEDDGGGWLARIPKLGSMLFKGWGETESEAVANLYEVGADILAEYERRGLERPQPASTGKQYSGRFQVRTLPAIHALLAEKADEDDQSLNGTVNAIFTQYFEHRTLLSEILSLKREVLALQRQLVPDGGSPWLYQSMGQGDMSCADQFGGKTKKAG